MLLELKSLSSPDLSNGEIPDDPKCCSVAIYAEIGPKGEAGAERFGFDVVTTDYLATNPVALWGKGCMILPEFSWDQIERLLARQIAQTTGSSWADAAMSLSRYMNWEFEDYRPYPSKNG
ncbi:MAG TPA: Imm8 family immunity protein [Xanthomonadaceae bacterium]|nr:Imm8 family immunity protein [Xanthomonadaceae bacterium]